MLYSEIEARVLKNINSTTADVSVAVDNAIDFLGNFYHNEKIDSSQSTVIAQDYLAKPTLSKEVDRVEINGIEFEKAVFKKLSEIKDYSLQKFFEYDGKVKLLPVPTAVQSTKIYYKSFFTPLAGVAGAVTDVPNNLIPLLISVATWFFLEQTENIYDYTGSDGWIKVNDIWTVLSIANAPLFAITVPAGATSKYQAGMRIKLTQTTTKYFIIQSVSNTTIYVQGGGLYALTTALISNISFSTANCPFGFPDALKNPYVMRAYAGATQVLTINTNTVIAVNTKSYDPASNFDVATYQYTVPISGDYSITGHVKMGVLTTGQRICAVIEVNGASAILGADISVSAYYSSSIVTSPLRLNAGDTVRLCGFCTEAGKSTQNDGAMGLYLVINKIN